jgi:hypothetical protein
MTKVMPSLRWSILTVSKSYSGFVFVLALVDFAAARLAAAGFRLVAVFVAIFIVPLLFVCGHPII